jgi:hyperosmotically inducible protein
MRMRIGFVAGFCCGAAACYFLDPQMGRTRRAKSKDEIAGFIRSSLRDARRTGRAIGAQAYGLTRKLTHPRLEHPEPVDDTELAHRVMSEIFRDPAVPKGAISINAQEGVVQLRGQLDTRAQIELVEAAVRKVAGVRGVDKFLHTPDTLPPNKAEVLEGERAPSYGAVAEGPTARSSDNPTT